nr:reverse transcriptase domain-containing protein [Tanacetum cinerariifolium]
MLGALFVLSTLAVDVADTSADGPPPADVVVDLEWDQPATWHHSRGDTWHCYAMSASGPPPALHEHSIYFNRPRSSFFDPESVIRNRRRNLGDPSLLLDFEEIHMTNNNNNVQGPPPAGHNILAPDFRPMEELLQAPTDGVGDAIVVTPVLASKFELKIGLLNLITAISFFGFENDDPHSHIRRTTNLRNEITRFQQRLDETFSEAWDQFKDLLNNWRKFIDENYSKALTIIKKKSKVRISRNKPQVSSASGSSSQDTAIIARTKQSGIVLAGPSVLPSPSSFSSSKEVKRDPKTITDQLLPRSTTRVPPPVVQLSSSSRSSEIPLSPTSRSVVLPERNPNQPPIPYPSSLAEALALIPKKLPEKLGDPMKFLILCDFPELEKCMALADLGTIINLIPLFIWKNLMLPELVSTRMTVELANHSVAYPAGIAEDVCVQVGKFTFPADFIVVNYDVDPRVPLILRIPFLRTARALVDVYGEELILRDKSPHPLSGRTTPHSDSFPSLTSSETSDSSLEEFADELALLEPIPLGNKDDNFDPEVDLREIEYLMNRDPSTDSLPETDIYIIDPILESPIMKNRKSFCMATLLTLTQKMKKTDLKIECLIDDMDDDFFPLLPTCNSTLPEESSEIATLLSSPSENEDRVFNPCILILGGTQIFHEE